LCAAKSDHVNENFLLRKIAKAISRVSFHAIFLLLLASCAQTSVRTVLPPIEPVGDVVLVESSEVPTENLQLEVGVLVFDANPLNEDDSLIGDWIFEEIVQNETQYLPYVLRNTLVESNQWGAVRVLPQEDPSVDILVSGTLVKSDGVTLDLQIQAVDSTGREWLNKTYSDVAGDLDYPDFVLSTHNNLIPPNSEDPFKDIYEQIANDLLSIRARLTEEELVNISRVSQMLYAKDLSPETFADFLQQDPDGTLRVSRLLASNDPMLSRVSEMRFRHHLFIDTVDGYYSALYEEMKSIYDLWRLYSYEELLEVQIGAQAINPSDDYGGSGNFLSLTQSYNRYKWSKIYEQEFNALAVGFSRELAPAILELNSRVHGLTGTMDEQYDQWRIILRDLFALETAGQEDLL